MILPACSATKYMQLTKGLAKLLLYSLALRQIEGIGHPVIEALVKVNQRARVGTARMPRHQCVTL